MAEQWEEEQHLDDIVGIRRMEGSSLKLDVICRQIHVTRNFSHAPCTCDHTHIVAQGV